MRYTVDTIFNNIPDTYAIFTNDKHRYNLNLIGVRALDRDSDTFNDLLYVIYRYSGKWHSLEYNVTTDPGLIYREKPLSIRGTAAVLPGQYRGMWCVGKHKGKYTALVQKSPCTVVRDNNRDTILDCDIPPYSKLVTENVGGILVSTYLDIHNAEVFKTETGIFGINCHRSGKGVTEYVKRYSAGCIVFADNDAFDNEFIPICKDAASIFGNSFTFTLLDEKDFGEVKESVELR